MSLATIQLSLEWDLYNPVDVSYFPESFFFLLIEKDSNTPIFLGKAFEKSVESIIKHELFRFQLTLQEIHVLIGFITLVDTSYVLAPQHLECLEQQLIEKYNPIHNRNLAIHALHENTLVEVVADDFDTVEFA